MYNILGLLFIVHAKSFWLCGVWLQCCTCMTNVFLSKVSGNINRYKRHAVHYKYLMIKIWRCSMNWKSYYLYWIRNVYLSIQLFISNRSVTTEVGSASISIQLQYSFKIKNKCGMFCDLIRNGVEGHENQYKYVNPLQVQWYNMLIVCY